MSISLNLPSNIVYPFSFNLILVCLYGLNDNKSSAVLLVTSNILLNTLLFFFVDGSLNALL